MERLYLPKTVREDAAILRELEAAHVRQFAAMFLQLLSGDKEDISKPLRSAASTLARRCLATVWLLLPSSGGGRWLRG